MNDMAEIKANADRLVELTNQQSVIKAEIDEIKAWFEKIATDDLKDTKKKTIDYWGSNNSKVVVGNSETVKPVSMTMVKKLLGDVFEEFVKEDTSYKMTDPCKRLFAMIFLGNYTEGSLDETIKAITADEKIQRTLKKKLKGKYEKDTETLIKLAGLPEQEASDWAYKAIKYKAVISFSNEEDLWKEWEEIYTDLSNENHEADAREFFERHREKMLEGTEVLWEEKLSYYDLMVMRLTEGEASFNSEEQNEPINPEDCIFNPEWFEFYNEAEIDFKNRDFLFFGFVDPSLGKTKHSDFSAIITLAKHKVSGYMYVMDADIERRHPDKIIGDILEKEKMLRRDYGRGYKKFGAETVQFQWFLKEELAKASAKAGLYLPIEEVPQTSDKTMRIQTMQPDVKNHYIKFNKRHKRLLEQMEHFPMGAHDDGVDALEGCRTIAKKMKRFRVLDKGKLGL